MTISVKRIGKQNTNLCLAVVDSIPQQQIMCHLNDLLSATINRYLNRYIGLHLVLDVPIVSVRYNKHTVLLCFVSLFVYYQIHGLF